MRGPDDLAECQSVHFRAELAPVVAGRRYGLRVITHPDAAGVLMPKGERISGRTRGSGDWPGAAGPVCD
jgi:hypothetical protein